MLETVFAVSALVVAIALLIGAIYFIRLVKSFERQLEALRIEIQAVSQDVQTTLRTIDQSLDRLTEDVHRLLGQATGTLERTEHLALEMTDRSREVKTLTTSLKAIGERLADLGQVVARQVLRHEGKVVDAVTLASAGMRLWKKLRQKKAMDIPK
ncbi:MAG: DUF948 domain-containing protein [Hydrogenibacillus sp.]|nr:DUF948 domain-containing protein [Hydrogenibacillus sp.]